MSRKDFFFSIVILITLVIGLGMFAYFPLTNKAKLLKDHYPVFNKKLNRYELVNKKPAHWVSVKNISKELKFAIIISEDWAFFEHEGIDANQLKIVIQESFMSGKLSRGASTITQQVVKNSFLTNEKSILRKLKEILIAKKLEQVLTKDQILEHYLNLIELGKGIYGVQKGSQFYFKKKPHEINAKEGAFMAMLLPSPKKYSQSFDKKELTDFASKQINSILKKMKIAKVLDAKKLKYYKNLKLSFEKGMTENNILANDYFEEELIMNDFEKEMLSDDPVQVHDQEIEDMAREFAPEEELDLDEEASGEY